MVWQLAHEPLTLARALLLQSIRVTMSNKLSRDVFIVFLLECCGSLFDPLRTSFLFYLFLILKKSGCMGQLCEVTQLVWNNPHIYSEWPQYLPL
jgi:hypothetical protein